MATNETTPAEIIRQQIGHKALYMMGAKNLLNNGAGLSFKIMRNSKKVTHVQIKVNALDYYDVEFVKCSLRAKVCRVVLSSVENCPVENLHEVLEAGTGLYTSL